MEFTELTFRLLFIFFPGIIATIIVDLLVGNREKDFKVFLLHSFIYGLLSYSVLYVITSVLNFVFNLNLEISFFNSINGHQEKINGAEVVVTAVISIVLGFVIASFINNKILHKIAWGLKVTKNFPHLDVWGYVFDSPDIEWIIVRNVEQNLMYQGWVEAFADTHEKNELFLRDVDVYRNSTAEFLYSMDGVYLSGSSDTIILEFPITTKEGEV